MTAGILKETGNEKRVALLPGEVATLKNLGIDVIVEHEAGEKAFASDSEYKDAGALIKTREEVLSGAGLLLSVNIIPEEEIESVSKGTVLCSSVNVASCKNWLEKARKNGLTVLALDLIPRITKAQSMDILSSMATVAGYKAVIEAASLLPKFFPMFMSAAGTIKPAHVLILGAGVAGLQALAIARKLGAVVEVFDVRSAVKEEVKSLGGKFIEVEGATEDSSAGGYAIEQTEDYKRRQKELIQNRALWSDVIITTAQIPGRRAPVLILRETVNAMKPGSVIIDLAASTGGNCELTENDKTIIVNGVKIVGKSNFPSDMPADASKMMGSNIINLLKTMIGKDGTFVVDIKDEIVNSITAVHNNEYVSPAVKQILNIK